MHRCLDCWSEMIEYTFDKEYFCRKCAIKEADEMFSNMDDDERRELFDEAFGAFKDKEVFETFWTDLDEEDKLDLMGFERVVYDG